MLGPDRALQIPQDCRDVLTRAPSAAMGKVGLAVYVPDEGRAAAYDRPVYTEPHDNFGRGGTDALPTLRRLRNAAAGRSVPGGHRAHDAAPQGDGRRP